MKKIYILVLKAYLGPLVMTFFIALFILLMQFLWKYVDDLVGKGLEWYVIAELLFYASSTFVPLALPLAILLSSLMTFGNLGEHYELVAIKAAGISLKTVMKPLVVLSLMISLLAFYFSNNILPIANLKFHSILYDVREQKLALNIKEGIFYDGIDGYVIRVGKKEKDGRTVRNIKIYDHSERQGNTNLTIAEWGTMDLTPDKKYLIFRLFNGENYTERTDQRNYSRNRPFQRTHFKEDFRRFDLSAFAMSRTKEDFFKKHYQMLNLSQLEHYQDSIQDKVDKRKNEFVHAILGSYFFFSTIDTNTHYRFDTVKSLHADFLSNFPLADKRRILDNAIEAATTTKESVKMHLNDVDARTHILYRYEIEIQRKFTLSLACLLLFFLGAPLGAIVRKGGFGLPVVFSVLLFVIYHILSMTGEKFSREGVLPAYEGMWIASLVFLPVGVFLTLKATTDSPLLDADAWRKLFRKIIPKKQKPGGK
ncbi:MAG: LptF/LptG family permease [Bacteroidetes bacterium]|nr:LptF/LptG family permease [Bacteroidota bacterium]